MSDVQETPAAAATAETTIPEVIEPQQTESAAQETTTTEQVAATTEIAPLEQDKTGETAPAEEKKDETTPADEKVIEPITEGLLSYKGPGLLRALVPSKKEFWLSDEPVSPLDMSSYLRGEKPEVGNPVVAWASQTGKGLLFFNKKGNSNKKQPGGVFALYDAVELRKQTPHEITFKLNGHEHQLKAATDAERDGWFISLEKAVELGKASKESIQESEGYKAELEKLSKPPAAAVAVAAAKRSQSQPKKSVEDDKNEDAVKDEAEASDEDKKKQKSRSTSRGMFNRLKGKKEEVEQKKEEKEEKKEEESKDDDKTAEVAGGVVGAAAVGGAVAATEEEKKETPEETPASDEVKAEEKPKPSKRTSIFGKMSGWGKTPTKEKDPKEAELTEDTKEPVVSENPPQLPESTATEATETPVVVEESKPAEDEKPEEVKLAKDESATPGKEKKAFLSGFSFGKRGRSVSPSQNVKEAPAKEEAPEADKTEEVTADSTAVDATAAAAPATVETTEKPEEKAEESPKTEATPSKRGSVFGSLGRRASQAIKGFQAPKKENATPKATDEAKTEGEPTTETTEEPKSNGESLPVEEPSQPQIGDVVPEAVNIGQPQQTPVISASA